MDASVHVRQVNKFPILLRGLENDCNIHFAGPELDSRPFRHVLRLCGLLFFFFSRVENKKIFQGYCLVEFEKREEAELAIAEMDGSQLLEQDISVTWAFVKGKYDHEKIDCKILSRNQDERYKMLIFLP